MKKLLLVCMFVALVSVVMAVPFASRIRVSSVQAYIGAGLTITYVINEDGGTAAIDIIKASDSSVVASFSGTATKGTNTVIWDGTANNAGGAQVPAGAYKVKITVSATKPAGWTEIASNSSVGNYVGSPSIYQTLWDGCSPMEFLIQSDPTKDAFGYVIVSAAYATPQVTGHVVFNPDLSCFDGGTGQNTWLNYPGSPTTISTCVWGNCFDPDDSDYVWVCGQNSTVNVMFAKWDDLTLTDRTNSVTALGSARDICVVKEGSTKYAYVALGSSTVFKAAIDATNNLVPSPAPINIIGTTITTLYSKGVDFDSEGNLYWTVRYDTTQTSGAGCVVYRWDAATVQSATAASLTDANATWIVTFPTGATNAEGITITPDGNVYAAIVNEGALSPVNDGTLRGIYLLGNKSLASNVKQLTATDRVYAFFGTTSIFSGYGLGIMTDYAGNIYWADRNQEQVRCVSPGGTTSIPVVAPDSQTFDIEDLPLNAKNWVIYE